MDLLAFVPQFGGFLYTVASFVVALSVIVAVHEYGHYIVGRWSGIHAEVFSLGFGPVLWSRMDKRGTRWQVAALPFGGYVKFLGDVDAASGKDAAAMEAAAADPEALRRTMHGAPLWARAATVAAGPVFNFAMSAIIFTAVALSQGTMREPLTIGELAPLPAIENGLQQGDELVSAGGVAVPNYLDSAAWEAFRDAIPQEQPLEYVVRRDGAETTVSGPYLYPPYVRGVVPRSAASDAGLQQEDVIVAVDGAPLVSFDQLKQLVEAADGKVLVLDVWRGGETVEMALAPRRTDEAQPDGSFATRWRIGIVGGLAFTPATEPAGFGESLAAGSYQVWAVIETSLSGLKHMISGAISTCNLSGPIGIAETSGAMASQGAESFIRFIAVLSTAVGLLNLFPVPALDGGHLMFYAYEAVAGRPPSDRAVRVLMSLGIAIVLSLMVFALGNDLFC
ncbi:RIP metalloprotease RseP [Leisingera aquaemixtae]|uniref:RIP metalloprotease RseP n=1 Tax=Leisingera aquaemixtae TaxID=1396826 RepID=UPI001C958411|nr:RIP metalloprotease RseP [Leisingera aquaemixtae]MBY6065467.1 RIP metalloprotease RseP [Leisingera aquaemixtae]